LMPCAARHNTIRCWCSPAVSVLSATLAATGSPYQHGKTPAPPPEVGRRGACSPMPERPRRSCSTIRSCTRASIWGSRRPPGYVIDMGGCPRRRLRPVGAPLPMRRRASKCSERTFQCPKGTPGYRVNGRICSEGIAPQCAQRSLRATKQNPGHRRARGCDRYLARGALPAASRDLECFRKSGNRFSDKKHDQTMV